MPTPILPKLNDNTIATTAGKWDFKPDTVLAEIGSLLTTGNAQTDYRIDAIPDIWARPLFVQIALFDNANIFHNKILEEWRGLVTLIGLYEFLHGRPNFRLSLKRLDIERGERTDFEKAAKILLPISSLASDTEWTKLYIIYFNDTPIGITSPTTLLCTGVEANISLVPNNGNLELNVLGNKIPLNSRHKEALGRYLNFLQHNITNHLNEDNILRHSLTLVINSFIQSLNLNAGRFGDQGKFNGTNNFLVDTIHRLEMNRSDIFRYLDYLPEPEEEISDVRLIPSANCGSVLQILVIDEQIATEWGKAPQDIHVAFTFTLADIRNLHGDRKSLFDKSLKNAEWRTPDDFFTKKLMVIDNTSDAFLNTIPIKGLSGNNASVVLPLSEELLKYFTPEEITGMVSVKFSNNEYTVDLKLPLSGGIFPIKKVYKDNHEHTSNDYVEHISQIPTVVVWPDFYAEDWNEYYTYYTGGGFTFYAAPFPIPADEDKRINKVSGHVNMSISKLGRFPDAFLIYSKSQSPQIYRGMILVNKLTPSKVMDINNNKWKVGVDFGTSNTMVYYTVNGSEPLPLNFTLGFLPLTSIPTAAQREAIAEDFFTDRIFEVPNWTSLKVFDAKLERRILDGHIYDKRNVPSEFQVDPNTHIDLKWGDNNKLCILFLEHLALWIRAEARKQGAKDITWIFSYPTSFDVTRIANAQANWDKINNGNTVPSKTESLASAIYFNQKSGIPVGNGSLCFDIGGGSTDMSLWVERKLLFQTSFKFAGKDILFKTLEKYPALHNILFSREKPIPMQFIDVGLSQFATGLLPLVWGASDAPLIQLCKRMVLFGIGGILYYAGTILKALQQQDQLSQKINFVCWGGNGSRLLDWIEQNYDIKCGNDESIVNTLFKEILSIASGMDFQDIIFKTSPLIEKKHEVAYGLVKDIKFIVPRSGNNFEVFSGEAYSSNGQLYPWNATLLEEHFQKGIEVTEYGNLKKLCQVVSKYTQKRNRGFDSFQIDDKQLKNVNQGVNAFLNTWHNQDVKTIQIAPIFILQVKKLLDELRKTTIG